MNTLAHDVAPPISPALAHVRRLLEEVNTDAIGLAAELLDAVESAARILRPLSDADTEAGRETAIALQILDDAAASAAVSAT